MPESQEVVIPSTVRQELLSGVHRMLKEENNELRKIREELKESARKRTRTVGWREREVRSRQRVELYTTLLTVLRTGCFNPPSGSNFPRVVLLETVERASLLNKGLSFVRGTYRRAVEIQAELKSVLWRV